MPKVGVTEPRQRIYELFLQGLIQAEVARILGVSDEAVRKIKVKLIDAGYLREIPGTGLYERGDKAKFFEKAVKLRKEVVEVSSAEISEVDGPQPTDTPAVKVARKTSRPQPSIRVEEYDVGTLEAHMHGYFIYAVDTLGHTDYIEVVKSDEPLVRVPLFTKGDNLDYHNNHRWDCDLRLPGNNQQVHLQLRKTPTKTQLYIYPPRVVILEEEYEQNKEQPGNLFQKAVYEVLDFLEKYGRWRFSRVNGCRVGRMVGQVYYALRDENLADHIPPNLAGYEDGKGMHIDCSKGIPEIEANKEKVSNVLFLLQAKDAHQQVEEEIKAVRQENLEREKMYEAERGRNLNRFIELEKEQGRMLDLQIRELKRHALEKGQSPPDSAAGSDEHSCGGMYG